MKCIEYYRMKTKIYVLWSKSGECLRVCMQKCCKKLNSELKNSKAVIEVRSLWSTVDWSSAVLVRRGVSDFKPTQIYFEQYQINMHVAFYPPPPPTITSF